MHEYRRLKNAPHLFPTELLKQKFLANIAALAEIMANMEEALIMFSGMDQDLEAPIDEVRQPMTEESVANGRIYHWELKKYRLPPFFPDMMNGKNPWNNWLDNSAKSLPGWIAGRIQILINKSTYQSFLTSH
jgi:hypothetical protein